MTSINSQLRSLQNQIESIDPADIKKYELRETKTGELRLEKLGVATRLVRWLAPESYDETTVINKALQQVHTTKDTTLHQGQLDFVLTKLLEKHVDVSETDKAVQGVFEARFPKETTTLNQLVERIESCQKMCNEAKQCDSRFVDAFIKDINAITLEPNNDAVIGHAKLHEARDALLADLNKRLDDTVIGKKDLQNLQHAMQVLDTKLGTRSRSGMELLEYRLSPAYEKQLIRAYTRKAHAFLRNPAHNGPEFTKALQNHRTYLGPEEFEKHLQHPRMQLLKRKALAKARDAVSNPLTIRMDPKIPKKPQVDVSSAPDSARPLLEKWVRHIPDPQAAHDTLWRASAMIRYNGEPLSNKLANETERQKQCIDGSLNTQYQVSLLCEELYEKAHRQFPKIDEEELRAVIGEAVCVRAIQYNPVDAITSLFNETYSAFFEQGDPAPATDHGFKSDRGYQFACIAIADGQVICSVIAHGETGFALKSFDPDTSEIKTDKLPDLSITATAYRKIGSEVTSQGNALQGNALQGNALQGNALQGKTWQGVVALKKPQTSSDATVS